MSVALMYAKLVSEAFCGNMLWKYCCYSSKDVLAIVSSSVVATVPSPPPTQSLNVALIKPNDSQWKVVKGKVQR